MKPAVRTVWRGVLTASLLTSAPAALAQEANPAAARAVCEGQGAPTVVFDYGNGMRTAFSYGNEWDPLKAEVARLTRVCAVHFPVRLEGPDLTSAVLAKSYWAALQDAGVEGPTVWFADHLGTFTALAALQQRPNDVKGLILFHPQHPQQFDRLFEALPAELKRGKQPVDVAELGLKGYDLKGSVREAQQVTTLEDRPLLLFTADRLYHYPSFSLGWRLDPSVRKALNDVNARAMNDLLAFSSRGERVELPGHLDPHDLEQPAFVAAVKQLLDAVRNLPASER